jgi:hypothetical protein
MHAPNGILGFDLPDKQTDYWILPDGEPHKIGQWPKSGSLRAETRYRRHEKQLNFPMATRYLVHFHNEGVGDPPVPPDLDVWFWVDISGGSAGRYEGQSELGPFEPRINFLLTEEPDLFGPQNPGVQLIVEVFHAATVFSTTYKWHDAAATSFVNPIQTLTNPPTLRNGLPPPAKSTTRFTDVFGLSECYDFPLHPDLDPGFAAFNGVDAYISLTQNTPNFNAPFVLQADVRLHDVTSFWPIFGKEGTGGFVGMDGDDLIFVILILDTDWVPVLDTWFNWRLEFEQETQLGYKLFIDDVEVMHRTTNRVFAQLNNLGVYRHNSDPTIWANMDMKNLKILTGDPPSTDVKLDMPLIVNALDSGPLENHGTTFNMDLPSS